MPPFGGVAVAILSRVHIFPALLSRYILGPSPGSGGSGLRRDMTCCQKNAARTGRFEELLDVRTAFFVAPAQRY